MPFSPTAGQGAREMMNLREPSRLVFLLTRRFPYL